MKTSYNNDNDNTNDDNNDDNYDIDKSNTH